MFSLESTWKRLSTDRGSGNQTPIYQDYTTLFERKKEEMNKKKIKNLVFDDIFIPCFPSHSSRLTPEGPFFLFSLLFLLCSCLFSFFSAFFRPNLPEIRFLFFWFLLISFVFPSDFFPLKRVVFGFTLKRKQTRTWITHTDEKEKEVNFRTRIP